MQIRATPLAIPSIIPNRTSDVHQRFTTKAFLIAAVWCPPHVINQQVKNRSRNFYCLVTGGGSKKKPRNGRPEGFIVVNLEQEGLETVDSSSKSLPGALWVFWSCVCLCALPLLLLHTEMFSVSSTCPVMRRHSVCHCVFLNLWLHKHLDAHMLLEL